MNKTVTEIANIALSGTKDGKIEVATLGNPYGEGSESVVSIGIFLSAGSQEPDWKVHIPKDNVDAVISALNKAKEQI